MTHRLATITKTCYNTQIHTTHPTKVAPHSCCHSNRPCVYQQYIKSMFLLLLTTSDHQWCWYTASINPFLLFAGVHSVRNVTVATSTSLPSPRRSYRGHCHPGQHIIKGELLRYLRTNSNEATFQTHREKHVENMKKRGYRQETIDESIRGIKFPDRLKTLASKPHAGDERLKKREVWRREKVLGSRP